MVNFVHFGFTGYWVNFLFFNSRHRLTLLAYFQRHHLAIMVFNLFCTFSLHNQFEFVQNYHLSVYFYLYLILISNFVLNFTLGRN